MIEYRSSSLDSVALQENDLDNKLRTVLGVKPGVPTVPQIVLRGEHSGGASELFELGGDGNLQECLLKLGFPYDFGASPNLNKLMPQYLQTHKRA